MTWTEDGFALLEGVKTRTESRHRQQIPMTQLPTSLAFRLLLTLVSVVAYAVLVHGDAVVRDPSSASPT